MLLFRAWQSILSWPIDEDRVPEFFADLLQQWGRERLVPVCGPPTKAEAESAKKVVVAISRQQMGSIEKALQIRAWG